jgi:hypothetical protein
MTAQSTSHNAVTTTDYSKSNPTESNNFSLT